MGIKKIKGLPLFEAKLSDTGCRILRVSLVDAPAVQVDFKAYADEQMPKLYEVVDEDLRRVFGVVLRADHPMYREDMDGNGYYITFGADTIRAFAQKYLAEGRQNEVDLDHDFRSIEGAQMVQYFIKDAEGGIAPKGFDEVKDGSLFAEYQITDEELWAKIKDGSFKGFSVEIIHADMPVMDYSQKSINMSKMEKIKSLLTSLLAEVDQPEKNYGEVSSDKGVIRWEGEEDLKQGDKVFGVDADDNRIDLEDGDYILEDKVVVVAGGEVKEIKDKEVVEESKPEESVDEEAEKKKKQCQEEEGGEQPEGAAAPEAEVDVEALKARIAELEGIVAEKEAVIADLEAKLNAPAGEPAHQAFKKIAYSAENPFEECKKYIR